MGTLLDNSGINLDSSEQEKLFTTLKLFKPNCVGFCGNFSNNWFTNQFINWDQGLWDVQNATTFSIWPKMLFWGCSDWAQNLGPGVSRPGDSENPLRSA